ncbi:hypothetical protein LOTGIDRAFT_172211 [Lottia gigantea]|uniref:Costars domain-containing protein n=1 Tax=Lottia gigantea TaxID=225164 RepID=V4B4E8_LOTGI|nr:hypothetical protein LOTGIDRAFT_172211 [Lottia gigantea]ESP02331.1 hypothetical protein LOTGIDRAFT_172211 [Lottia gigantea]
MAAPKNFFKDQVTQWQKKVDHHRENQLINPFSDWEGASHRPQLDKNDPNYGKPVGGSLTEIRGKQAQNHVFGEILDLTMTIDDIGEPQPDGTKTVTFGKLFSSYLRVSNKVVGILLRARKRNYVKFEGEMLYQGRDENVVITLLEVPEDTRVWEYVPSFMSGGFE